MARSRFFCQWGALVGGHPKVTVGGHRALPVTPCPDGQTGARRRQPQKEQVPARAGPEAPKTFPGDIRPDEQTL